MTDQRVRILVIDNLAVESARRTVYRTLAARSGWEVSLLVPTAWKETREPVVCEDEIEGNIHLYRSEILFGFRHQRVMYRKLSSVVRTVRPHFILAVAQPESYAAAQVCFVRRRLAPHAGLGLFSSRNIDYRQKGFPYRLELTHRLCDAITRRTQPELCFYRPSAAADLLGSYAKRLVFVPHVVDCSQFRRSRAEAAEEANQLLVIGYLGRIVKEKGLHILLQAMSHLPPHITLKLIGTGPDESELHALARRIGMSERVEFLGPIPYHEVPAALNAMDLLVLPSLETEFWTELFGRVLIEAMACGLPIVASRSGGIPEVVGDAALLVPPGDARALAGAIACLCSDAALRCQMGQKGRDRALERYDAGVVAALLEKEINNSLESVATEGKEGW